MNLIVAVDRNWGIGCGNKLLAHIPEDMKYFREKTMGKTVVMGRKTFESLPNGALPNRRNIVLTRNPEYKAEGAEVICFEAKGSSQGFFYVPENSDDMFIIGGEQIYKLFLPYCTRAYVTKIDAEFEADAFMVNLDKHEDWVVESAEKMSTQSGVNIEFIVYMRK